MREKRLHYLPTVFSRLINVSDILDPMQREGESLVNSSAVEVFLADLF